MHTNLEGIDAFRKKSMYLRVSVMSGSIMLCVDSQNRPVIPISSKNEVEVYTQIAALYDTTLEVCEGQERAEILPVTRGGVVLACGKEASEAALLYAHLTGRATPIIVENEEDLPIEKPAVVLAISDQIPEFMTKYLIHNSCSSESATGLIVGLDRKSLVKISCKFAAALACSKAGEERGRTFILSSQQISKFNVAQANFLGGASRTDDILDELMFGRDVLTILAHSNGYHLNLGGNFLCPLKENIRKIVRGAPVCFVRKMCTAFGRPRLITDDAIISRLHPIKSIIARHLVLLGCGAIRFPTNKYFSPYYSLAVRIAEDATVGACFTLSGPETVSPDGRELYGLINSLSKGTTAGMALSKFVAEQNVRRSGINLYLLGDPDFAIKDKEEISNDLPILALPYLAEMPDFENDYLKSTNKSIHKSIIENAMKNLPIPNQEIFRDVIPLIDKKEENLDTTQVFAYKDLLDRRLCLFFAQWPWYDEIFDNFPMTIRERRGICNLCGNDLSSYCFVIPQPNPRYRVSRCLGCDATQFGPAEREMPVTLDKIQHGHLQLRRPVRGQLCLTLMTQSLAFAGPLEVDFASRIIEWPAYRIGEPYSEFTFDGKLPISPVRAAICTVEDCNLFIQSLPLAWDR